jgi:hypothetical protein
MKTDDQFLRNYRKMPRKAFSKDLYRRLNGQRSASSWLKRSLMWGMVTMLVIYGLSGGILPGRLVSTVRADVATMHQVERMVHCGLALCVYTPTPGKEDRPLQAAWERPAMNVAMMAPTVLAVSR